MDLIDLGLRGPVTAAQHLDLDRIRRSQQHLTGLVTDILNLARVGSGGLRYNIRDVAVRDVLTAGVMMVEPLIAAKQLTVAPIACDPDTTARADSEKLTQILVNLFSNAIKFTDAGGRITVSCVVRSQQVQIHVADTGIGVPPQMFADIFEPFVQVRPGLAGRDTGVGLGLAISRDLARGVGGDPTIESRIGVGTTLTVSLALANDAKSKGADD